MKKTGIYYKKIVTRTKDPKEANMFFHSGILFIGLALGWLMRIASPSTDNNILVVSVLIFVGICFMILNYFITRDTKIKYEKYEVKRK